MNFELPTVRDPAPADGLLPGKWWHKDGETDRVICDLCPRECAMKDGDRGFCFVRQNVGGEMMLTTYGRSTGFCIDPIEKKPLNHFYPGTSVLSFGTAGCNLGCKFCQNWDISKAREVERLSHRAFPEEIALAAKSLDCHSVAYTYNDPIVWAEYAIETVTYYLDGTKIYSRADNSGELARKKEIKIYEGSVPPGNHQVTANVMLRGNGFGIFSYLNQYTLKVQGNYSFISQEGKVSRVRIIVYERKGLQLDFTDRPFFRYEVQTDRNLPTGESL